MKGYLVNYSVYYIYDGYTEIKCVAVYKDEQKATALCKELDNRHFNSNKEKDKKYKKCWIEEIEIYI